jgi:putative CocE/NonD family hydrolase
MFRRRPGGHDAVPTHAAYLATRPARYQGFDRTSRYLTMRDGVRIAVDICLPRGLRAEKVPTILRQTRYFRRFQVRAPFGAVLGDRELDPMNAPMRDLFTSRGYAWIDVDVRGSGASFGDRPCPWYLPGEVMDGREIAQFVVEQPWSNGRIGSTGVSYDGTTADFLAITQHPAVRAIAPRYSLYDVYADIAFPGGLRQAWFTETWERANSALDRNAPGDFLSTILSFGVHGGPNPKVADQRSLLHTLSLLVDSDVAQKSLGALVGWVISGVPPVDDDPLGDVLRDALASHSRNFSTHDGALQMTFRDDSPTNAPVAGATSDAFSPKTYVSQLADVAILSYGGWFDAAYAASAVQRHRESGNPHNELLLGPWTHGGGLDMDPDGPRGQATFDHATELLRFFDRHLLLESPSAQVDVAPVRYFQMGKGGRWRNAATFPPEETQVRTFHLAADHALSDVPSPGIDTHVVDPTTRLGKRSRWRTLVSPFVHADGEGRSTQGLLVYETGPLPHDLIVTGSPVLVLCLSTSTAGSPIFAYLDDVTPDGRARLVTEGLVRTLHRTTLVTQDGLPRREATFKRADALNLGPDERFEHVIELLPVAMNFGRGHRLRLSLAGVELDHFEVIVGDGPTRWTVDRGRSRLLLPVT